LGASTVDTRGADGGGLAGFAGCAATVGALVGFVVDAACDDWSAAGADSGSGT
jgi:hypothetical protein